MLGSEWRDKLNWVINNYQAYQKYGLTPHILHRYLLRKRKENLKKLESNRDLFDIISVDDNRISPLTERYLADLIFYGKDRSLMLGLIEKCNYEDITKFKEDVYLISGIDTTSSRLYVLDKLMEKFGYTYEEIKLYLIALNKNIRGLVGWYNTGEMYYLYPKKKISLDQPTHISKKPEEEGRLLSEEIDSGMRTDNEALRNETLSLFLEEIKKKLPTYYGIFERLVKEYEGDINSLGGHEAQEFNKALHTIKSDKILLARIYEILIS